MKDATPATRSVFASLIRDPIAVVLAVVTVLSIVMIYRTRVRVAYGPNVVGGHSITLVAPEPIDAERVRIAWQPVDGAARYRVDVFDARLDTIVTIADARSPLELRIEHPAEGDAFYTVSAFDGARGRIAQSAAGRIRRESDR